jgi:hypothetical protein
MADPPVPDWTDHGAHDPGVTVLEVLAFAVGAAAFLTASVAVLRSRRRSRWADDH